MPDLPETPRQRYLRNHQENIRTMRAALIRMERENDRVELDSAELAELRRDAERFRWLREGHCGHVSVSVSEQEFGPGVHGNELDAAVDAARERADG